MDYATWYLEAIPLKGTQVEGVTQALVWVFSSVGIPKEILTDKRATFTLSLMAHLCKLLRIKYLFTTIYQLQTDGLIERMKQTLKDLLRKTDGAFPMGPVHRPPLICSQRSPANINWHIPLRARLWTALCK